ncbi:MAG: hypothetical protein AUJ92_01910 [Armatimonadetes bacterium CG2_30_59_28]|nr:N-acetylmuramoyl-L-alanine amidase [Armatimonadota bacterium]OIO98194.1 MAG: hypothetical protein AUJ92_01910 [Armatimonadetes bacterium CG2_30_59_28]PIU64167.1 MAG: hypothetical protein COS85_13615 [Armatimonadetes bacterium CG07_land_8_20_14_0_80_59_28]
MKIAIDPGHGMSNRTAGVYDPGACKKVRAETYCEADIVLKYALSLKQFAHEAGVDTFLTRTSSADSAPVTTRATRAKRAGCTHFVSLHLNASTSAQANGLEALYRRSTKDKSLAAALQHRLVQVTGFRDRGIKQRTDLAVLRFTGGPAVLIELGFISSKSDRDYLLVRDNRIAICKALLEVVK